MSIQAISGALTSGFTNATQAAAAGQNIPDAAFAALLKNANSNQATQQGTLLTPTATPADAGKPASTASEADPTPSADKKSPAELFLEYMHKTPEQRWHEAWLKQHGMTEAEFDKLPPEKKVALEAQMRDDLKEQVKQHAAKKAADPSTI